jgi:hypothetical protein
MKTIEEINKINEHKTQLEKLCSKLLREIQSNMNFKDSCSFQEKNSTMFTISSIESELKKLEEEHLI